MTPTESQAHQQAVSVLVWWLKHQANGTASPQRSTAKNGGLGLERFNIHELHQLLLRQSSHQIYSVHSVRPDSTTSYAQRVPRLKPSPRRPEQNRHSCTCFPPPPLPPLPPTGSLPSIRLLGFLLHTSWRATDVVRRNLSSILHYDHLPKVHTTSPKRWGTPDLDSALDDLDSSVAV
ncbi:MAG: hypothetical protein Q9228_003752 [Teloschistes exilis]